MDVFLLHTGCAAANVEYAEEEIYETSSSEYAFFLAARLNGNSIKDCVVILWNTMQHLAPVQQKIFIERRRALLKQAIDYE